MGSQPKEGRIRGRRTIGLDGKSARQDLVKDPLAVLFGRRLELLLQPTARKLVGGELDDVALDFGKLPESSLVAPEVVEHRTPRNRRKAAVGRSPFKTEVAAAVAGLEAAKSAAGLLLPVHAVTGAGAKRVVAARS